MITLLRQSPSLLRFQTFSALPICKSHLDLLSPFALHLRFSSSSPDPAVYEFLVHTHQFSPQSASQIASVLTRLRNPQRSDSIISFFKESGFSTSQLEILFKTRPRLLSANLDKLIKPKLNTLYDLGLSRSVVAQIISYNPCLLERILRNRAIPNLSLLKNLLGSDEKLTRFLNVAGRSLVLNLDNTLIPNVELLTKCGVSMDQIHRIIHHCPTFLLRRHEVMKKSVARADAMGVGRSSNQFIHAVRVISCMPDETWELKVRNFRELGFSDDDIAAMFRRQPKVFGSSREKIKKTKELLLANGKYNLFDIVRSPESLQYSIEKRYKPRLKVLELLEGKKLIQCRPPLSSLGARTDKEFFEKYVSPFSDEIGDVYIAKSRADVK